MHTQMIFVRECHGAIVDFTAKWFLRFVHIRERDKFIGNLTYDARAVNTTDIDTILKMHLFVNTDASNESNNNNDID